MINRIRGWLGNLLSGEGTPSAGTTTAWSLGERRGLAAVLLLALVLRVAVAILLPSVHHPDETFQYWEQGYRFAFGYGMVPWEYRTGIRSYLVPGTLAGVMQAVTALGGGLVAWQVTIQVLLSLLSLSIVLTAYLWARRVAGITAALLAGGVAAIWFELIYFGGKPLTESIAASLLFPAAYLLCLPHRSRILPILGGVLLGLTFVVRFQLAPAVLVVALASILANGWRRSLSPALATVVVVMLGGLLDWVTLGSPFQSVWLNFVVNAVHDKASSYGVEPPWWFALEYARVWGGLAAVLVALVLIGVRRAPVLLVLALVIVLAHSAIGHKEYRFVLPALPFLLTLAAIGASRLFDLATTTTRATRRAGALVALGLVLVVTSLNLSTQAAFRDNWTRNSSAIGAFRIAAEVEQSCGIGLSSLAWVHTPGYRGLGRDVPIYPLTSDVHAETLKPAFNVVVRWGAGPAVLSEYKEIGCSNGLCVAMRPGKCTPQPDQAVNPYLVRKGE